MTSQSLLTRVRTASSRAAELVFRQRRERRLAEEIAAHLDELAAGYEAKGLTRDEARLAARRAFGGLDQVVFNHREQRGLPGLDAFVQDLRFAVRILVKDRWYSAAGAIALALGIAVSTTVFTLISGITFQELPVVEPARVVHLVTQTPRGRAETSYPDLLDLQRAAASFEGLAAYADSVATVGDGRTAAEQLAVAYVTANAFAVLREQPIIGRAFEPDDDREGATPVAVLAHHVWTSRFAADPAILGRSIRIDGSPVTIVGVMREGLRFPIWTDVWQPLVPQPRLNRTDRQARNLGGFGRLAPGVSLATASAEMRAISAALASAYAKSNADTRVDVIPFTERYAGRATEGPPILMFCAVAMILLVACSNAAMLLLSRAAPRAREVALRTAMGASRSRILRQLLVETAILSAVAGALGLALAMGAVRLLREDLVDLNLPYWMQFVFDWRVFAFVAAICLATALGSGLMPAWHLSRTRASLLLKDGGRGVAGGTRARRWSGALLIAELALTLTLLAGAGLLTRSAGALQDSDRIANPASILSARLAMPAARFASTEARRTFLTRLEESLAANSVTQRAAMTTALPFVGAPTRPIQLDALGDAGDPRPSASVIAISDGYFDALGLPLVRGRAFSIDDPGRAVIVNQRFVELYGGGVNPIGRQLQIAESSVVQVAPLLTIVGVAQTFRQSPMRDESPVVFVPLRTQPGTGVVAVVVPDGDRPGTLAALTDTVRAVDPDVAVFKAIPLERLSAVSRFNHRMLSSVLTAMAVIAMFLSAIGLYGVTAFGVAQRTAEIGVRMALGGARMQLGWHLLRRTLIRVVLGVGIGLAGAMAAGQVLSGLLIDISPLDPVTFAIVVVVLGSVALAACLIPARRVLTLDPVAALRHE